MYWLFKYASKHIFLQTTIVKSQPDMSEFFYVPSGWSISICATFLVEWGFNLILEEIFFSEGRTEKHSLLKLALLDYI